MRLEKFFGGYLKDSYFEDLDDKNEVYWNLLDEIQEIGYRVHNATSIRNIYLEIWDEAQLRD